MTGTERKRGSSSGLGNNDRERKKKRTSTETGQSHSNYATNDSMTAWESRDPTSYEHASVRHNTIDNGVRREETGRKDRVFSAGYSREGHIDGLPPENRTMEGKLKPVA